MSSNLCNGPEARSARLFLFPQQTGHLLALVREDRYGFYGLFGLWLISGVVEGKWGGESPIQILLACYFDCYDLSGRLGQEY